jgi:hypothetical protein
MNNNCLRGQIYENEREREREREINDMMKKERHKNDSKTREM